MAVQLGIEEPLEPAEQAAVDAERAGQQQPADVSRETSAEPAAEAAPEQAQPDKGKPAKGKAPDAVPYSRFHETNEEKKLAQRERDELRERWARLEERAAMAREAQQRIEQAAQRPQPPARPDENVDPYGAQLWDRDRRIEELVSQQQQLAQQFQQHQQGLQQTQAAMQQGQQFSEFQSWLQNDVAAYRMQKPDYDAAATYAQQRMIEWASTFAPPEEVANIVNGLAAWAAQRSRASGRSAADAFYSLAHTMGYTGPKPAPGNGAPQSRAQATLEQVQKGQQHQGLSRAPAENDDNTNWSTMGAKELADMDDEAFAVAWADPKQRAKLEQVFRRLEIGA
jgi:hypothetical protein